MGREGEAARAKEIRRLLDDPNPRNFELLRRHAIEGGLINDEIRKIAWPMLLKVSSTPEIDLEKVEAQHKDMDQVEKDVDRSMFKFSAGRNDFMMAKRKQLSRIINTLLFKHPELHYYQGYHDVCSVFLMITGEGIRTVAIIEMQLMKDRDALDPTLESTKDILSLLFPLLQFADPELYLYIEKSGVHPYFAISWILTWFSHGFDNLKDISRLFDVFIASHPLMPLYVSCQIIIHFRKELLETVECEFCSVHSFLSKIPQHLPFDDIISRSVQLQHNLPPERLQKLAHHPLKQTSPANQYPFGWMPRRSVYDIVASNIKWMMPLETTNVEKAFFFVVAASFVAGAAYVFYEARSHWNISKDQRGHHIVTTQHMNNTLDPSEALPAEVFVHILTWLKEKDIRSCSQVNTIWRSATTEHAIWQNLCDQLWDDKVYVPKEYREMRMTDPYNAYKESIKDSTRDTITEEELLEFEWFFRFKEDPGAWYSDGDPWIQGRTPSMHKYQKGGGIRIEGDFSGAAPNRRKWRWLEDEELERGSWVQICHYPSYKIFRTSNWGWMQQSELAILLSFPMPLRGACEGEEYEDDNLPPIPELPRFRNHPLGLFSSNEQLPDTLINFLLQHVGQLPLGFTFVDNDHEYVLHTDQMEEEDEDMEEEDEDMEEEDEDMEEEDEEEEMDDDALASGSLAKLARRFPSKEEITSSSLVGAFLFSLMHIVLPCLQNCNRCDSSEALGISQLEHVWRSEVQFGTDTDKGKMARTNLLVLRLTTLRSERINRAIHRAKSTDYENPTVFHPRDHTLDLKGEGQNAATSSHHGRIMESHAVTTSLLEEQQHFSEHKSKWARFTSSFSPKQLQKSQAFTVTAARQYCAEILGTLLFVYVGTGTVVALAAKDSLNAASTNTCIALSFGFGVACMVYATANVSGGHLNPAITIAFMCTGNIDIVRGLFYIISQCIGSIAAAGLIRATTPPDSWEIVSGGATILGRGITVTQGVFLEVIITYMLIFTVFGTVQLRNSSTGMGKLAGLAIGLAVLVSHTFGQSFTGPSMNPARSLGPAIVFSQWAYHWIYWVGPISGGLLAAITYQFVLQPEDKEKADVKYRKKLAAKQQKALQKQQRLSARTARRHGSKRGFFSHNDNPEVYQSINPVGPALMDGGLAPGNVPMDLDRRDSMDRDDFTMDAGEAVGQYHLEDPNFHPELDNVIVDPATTRIL
ncbi:hypothetical protein PROFUN_12388 [Planoprotostelium fungivorum]|uniref:Rab-GAP TBC domain-containing protein n=1 Tax=Planoprotostelium fungivorum TaxID=1890364 RepID=A0A2P6N7H5_9EUKA|nr:hypothetical protein PROFUN_12388 [Planoprotostelium fungivorum]